MFLYFSAIYTLIFVKSTLLFVRIFVRSTVRRVKIFLIKRIPCKLFNHNVQEISGNLITWSIKTSSF